MNKPKPESKPYWEMTTPELRAATRQYDVEDLSPKRVPAPRAQRDRHRRAMAKPGRRPVGKGAQRVLVTIERGLLARADALAQRQGLSRSGLIAQGLNVVLRQAG